MIAQDQTAVVDVLASPSMHGVASVERIETHTVIVCLAGTRAYKLKRAVLFDYLDVSTPERRRVLCDAEVRLNRRTAPALYRGTLAVTRERDGWLALGGSGTPVDWVVEMIRFDQEALFDRLAAGGRLDVELMPPVAAAIAEFHMAAERRADHGGKPGMAWVIKGNAAGFAEYGTACLEPSACVRVTDAACAERDRRGDLLDARRDAGFVRQCHGDLHLRNIVLLDGPASPYAMSRLIDLKDRVDVAFACDPDHVRHGIVTSTAGWLPPNHYLSVAIFYLFQHRPRWRHGAAVGKTVVSSQMIDRVTAKLGRTLYEVPVGVKWCVAGLLGGALGSAGEESAGASFARLDGRVWTTDKDGIVPALLAAEITARLGHEPGEIYQERARELGAPLYERIEAPATVEQKARLGTLSPPQVRRTDLAGEEIEAILTHAPGNGAAIGGVKVIAKSGCIYKIYAESVAGPDHLRRVFDDALAMVDDALAMGPPQ